MRPTARLVARLLLAPAAFLLACESTPQPQTPPPGASARRVLLLPLNVVSSLASELEAGADPVWNELRAFLEGHGKQLETLELLDARRRWMSSIRAAQEQEPEAGFESAARLLASDLAEGYEFDCLVVPSLVLRHAKLSHRNASWDNVKRKVEFINPPRRAGSLQLRADLGGSIAAASLHLVVLDPGGETLHEKVSGLVVVNRFRSREDRRYSLGGWAMERNPDAFASPENLSDGVARAFEPYLLPLPTTSP